MVIYIYNWVANQDVMVADNQRNVIHIIDIPNFSKRMLMETLLTLDSINQL